MTLKMRILIRGIENKISNGELLEDILESYINLTDEEKEVIRSEFTF